MNDEGIPDAPLAQGGWRRKKAREKKKMFMANAKVRGYQ